MKETVRVEMKEAVTSYEEKPREVWVFEPPAQVALCAVQIWWTVETNLAFLRLEEGFENSLKDFNKKQARALCCCCLLNVELSSTLSADFNIGQMSVYISAC